MEQLSGAGPQASNDGSARVLPRRDPATLSWQELFEGHRALAKQRIRKELPGLIPEHVTDQHPHAGPGHWPLLAGDAGQSCRSPAVRAAGCFGGQHT